MRIVDIVNAKGEAVGKITLGDTVTISSSYGDDNCDEQKVGHVVTDATRDEERDRLIAGDYVDVVGAVRDHFESCGKYPEINQRLVYETAETYLG